MFRDMFVFEERVLRVCTRNGWAQAQAKGEEQAKSTTMLPETACDKKSIIHNTPLRLVDDVGRELGQAAILERNDPLRDDGYRMLPGHHDAPAHPPT